MRRLPLALAFVLACSGAGAQQADPLQTPACQMALESVRSQEAALGAAIQGGLDSKRQHEAMAQLKTSRERAAHVCLRSRPDRPPPAGRVTQPPMPAPPTRPGPSPRVTQPQTPAAVPRVAPPVVSITSCDQAGCWASDGTRLQRAGRNALLGPQGMCTTSGNVLLCP